MTAVDDRPMTTGMAKIFEELEPPEGVKMELLRGVIGYRSQEIIPFGDPLPLKALGLELDTSEFGTLPGVKPHRYP
ncbi:hypothetical protein ABZ845_17200 [Streptomyces sp. NPDC047022]|uniref:hypothetical protein n=1 Tax=Streptomyces sp. NPDC047022 TaxID=3155737 RepID=UPI0033DFE4C8